MIYIPGKFQPVKLSQITCIIYLSETIKLLEVAKLGFKMFDLK